MPLICLIVEDEPLAAEVLSDYISQVPFLRLAGHCTDALKAMEFFRKNAVDVMFLDLHLPGIKGFDFLKTLASRPQVIVTTAYHQYALDGYEWNVVDYLVKPIEFSRFLAAVNKLKESAVSDVGNSKSGSAPARPFIFVHADKKEVKILLEEIMYIESERDYLRIVVPEKPIITRQTMNEFEKQMPPGQFIRVHRSFLVRRHAITAFNTTQIEVPGRIIPIGRQFREAVLSDLRSFI